MKNYRIRQTLRIVLLSVLVFTWFLTEKASAQNFSNRYNSYLPSSNKVQALTKGYYFVQQVTGDATSEYGAISTEREADSIVEVLNKHLVSGVEYSSLWFHQDNITGCVAIAEILQLHGIDLWLSSGSLGAKVPGLNNDNFPSQYRACSLAVDGSIVPAEVWCLAQPNKMPAFDWMNPAAMNWFLDRYKQIYLEPMKQYTSGYFFNEDCLFYGMDLDYTNNSRIDYNELPAYSDAVLALWQNYCIDHSVMFNGSVVSKFPVHLASMVSNGGGKTEYYPGYNVPEIIESGTALVDIPRNTGIWAAWDDFVTSQFVESFIGGISKAVHEVNSGNPNFKGVIYFGAHGWCLAYEEVTDAAFYVDDIQRWMAWGTQRGVNLTKICSLPYVDHIICETFPPIQSNLYQFSSEFKRISDEHGKTFGLMIHRDDNWGLDGWDTEIDRWEMIQHFQPTIIARFPINRLFPSDQYYNEQKENLFDQRMLTYRPAYPSPPTLISPADRVYKIPIPPTLIWGSCVGVSKYHLQVSKDSVFTQLIVNDSTITVTSFEVGQLNNSTTYYWRVCGKTSNGVSDWSSTYSFTTIAAAPESPVLAAPADSAKDVQLDTTLSWNAVAGAAAYHLQLSTRSNFMSFIINDSSITATSRTIGPLSLATKYYWRIRAKNEGGYSSFSPSWQFTTILSSSDEKANSAIPKEYELSQNYPNPFNPMTKIKYDLPVTSRVTLRVYDILGRVVLTLVNKRQSTGSYQVQWNAVNMPSGIYFYRLQAGSFTETKKLLLLK
jgi:hypothetical protein